MGMRASTLRTDERTIALSIGAETLNVTVRLSGITPIVEEAFQDRIADNRMGGAVVAILTPALVRWDLLGDDDQPLGVGEDILRGLPLNFLVQVAQGIVEALAPKGTNGVS